MDAGESEITGGAGSIDAIIDVGGSAMSCAKPWGSSGKRLHSLARVLLLDWDLSHWPALQQSCFALDENMKNCGQATQPPQNRVAAISNESTELEILRTTLIIYQNKALLAGADFGHELTGERAGLAGVLVVRFVTIGYRDRRRNLFEGERANPHPGI